ncbi:hypothetical protein BBP40_002167 [Aspergillus hancockii]|nr:hypothetical protein BBP40_002167 [Aspergillus hancockii]
MGVVVETASDEYRRNGFSKALAIPKYGEAFPYVAGCTVPATQALLAWLKENNYRSPTDAKNMPFIMGFNTDLYFFEYINNVHTYPGLLSHFNGSISACHQGRPSWMDLGFYSVEERLIHGAQARLDDVSLWTLVESRGMTFWNSTQNGLMPRVDWSYRI